MPLAMGRPRRGMADKENGDTSHSTDVAGSPPRMSRPWDNLKALETRLSPQTPRNLLRCNTPASLNSDNVKKAHPKLPHERFTPLLRTTFTEEIENNIISSTVAKFETATTPPVSNAASQNVVRDVLPLQISTAQPCADSNQPRVPLSSNRPGLVKLGNRDVKPLNLEVIVPPMVGAALPIPNKPTPPQHGHYRHSIRQPSPDQNSTDIANQSDSEASGDDDDCDESENEASFELTASPKRHSVRVFPSIPKRSSFKTNRHSVRATPSSGMYSDDEQAVDSMSDDDTDNPVRRPNLVRDSSFAYKLDGRNINHDADQDNSPFPSVGDFLCFETDKRLRTPPTEKDATAQNLYREYSDKDESDLSEPDTFDTDSSEQSPEDSPELQLSGFLDRFGLDQNPRGMQPKEMQSPDIQVQSPSSISKIQRSNTGQRALQLAKAPTSLQILQEVDRLPTAESEKPSYPDMSHNTPRKKAGGSRHFIYLKGNGYDDDDDGDVFDGPEDMGKNPGIEPALRDLQRASIKAGNELAVTAFAVSTAQRHERSGDDRVSRAQGELFLRSRFLRRWNARYASIVDHAYFGAVLFLFCHDADISTGGTVALKNSKMIVLAGSNVREVQPYRKRNTTSLFELCTSQRKYVFACEDDHRREYWLSNLTMCDE